MTAHPPRRSTMPIGAVFKEPQIFRIDHYLGKETVQNLMALRFANALVRAGLELRPYRSRADHGRGDARASRSARTITTTRARCATWCRTTCCSCFASWPWSRPPRFDADALRDEKLKVLKALMPIDGAMRRRSPCAANTAPARRMGRPCPAISRRSARKSSNTETFVAIKADIANWRWAGVPFYLRTGKRLPQRVSEIVVAFRPVPHSIFDGGPDR